MLGDLCLDYMAGMLEREAEKLYELVKSRGFKYVMEKDVETETYHDFIQENGWSHIEYMKAATGLGEDASFDELVAAFIEHEEKCKQEMKDDFFDYWDMIDIKAEAMEKYLELGWPLYDDVNSLEVFAALYWYVMNGCKSYKDKLIAIEGSEEEALAAFKKECDEIRARGKEVYDTFSVQDFNVSEKDFVYYITERLSTYKTVAAFEEGVVKDAGCPNILNWIVAEVGGVYREKRQELEKKIEEGVLSKAEAWDLFDWATCEALIDYIWWYKS